MIGSGLKKLAGEYGMKVSNGVAYGSMRGYAATMSEGAGYKRIVLTTLIQDPVKLSALRQQFEGRDLLKEFRVQELEFGAKFINIVFHDNPGTMKKIYAFLDVFFPLLEASEATKADICVECATPAPDGKWKLIEGTAYCMHEQCAQKILRLVQAQEEAEKLGSRESYLTGAVGALLGTVIGAVVWALVLKMGYVASIVGLLIAFLAVKGYDLLHGKQGKGKLLILLVCVVSGVVLGTFGAYTYELMEMIGSGELPGMSYSDIPMLWSILLEDSEFVSAALKDILMGLLFAALGAWRIMRQTGKQVAEFKMIDLD